MTTSERTDAHAAVLDVLRGRATPDEAARRVGLARAKLDGSRRDYLASKLPPANATLSVEVGAPVRIVRDGAGVPHVFADAPRDLFFGYGLALAQDRLWQIDHLRRRALGRLAEVLGPDAVGSDRRNLLLDFGRLADRELAALSDEATVALDGFAAGINAWIAQVRNNLPVEFDVLDYAPEPWSPRDSLALMRAFFWQLTGRLENIAAGEAAGRVLGDALATDFLTTESPDETIVPHELAPDADAPGAGRTGANGSAGAPPAGGSTHGGAADGLRPADRGATGGGDEAGGSNNWAISPARSSTGHAQLASDPHLPFSLPVGLYQVHLHGAGYDAAGAGYPGAPSIWFGRNMRVAWGLTNLVASPRDLYVETLDPSDPTRYREGDAWVPLDTRTEEIVVRGAPNERLVVRSTARGPLVDELVPSLGDADPSVSGADPSVSGPPPAAPTALSLRWVGHEVLGDVQAVLDLARARDRASFRAALSGWRLPIFNFVYADVDGHIGYQAAGSIPIRGDGTAARGYRPANDPAHAWRGFVPFDELPRLEDPARGWVGTANNRPVGHAEPASDAADGTADVVDRPTTAAGSKAPLYGWWAPGHRAVRLRRILDNDDALSPADMRAMHADTYSVRAEQAVPRLRATLTEHGGAAGARLLALLDGWDYRMAPDSRGALVFEAFFERWHERVLAARFPDDVRPFLVALGAGSGLALRLLTEGRPADWFAAAAASPPAASATADTASPPISDAVDPALSPVAGAADPALSYEAPDKAGAPDLPSEVAAAAADALRSLELRLGPDPAAWRWRALHTVSFRHPLAGRPGTEGLFSTGPAPVGGTGHVLNATGFAHAAPFDVLSGPEYRLVADLGDPDATLAVLTTGQSGQPGSPHYTDHLGPWLAGEYHPLPLTPAAVEAAKVGETRLSPTTR